jgi:hypothetical protein
LFLFLALSLSHTHAPHHSCSKVDQLVPSYHLLLFQPNSQNPARNVIFYYSLPLLPLYVP